MSTRQRFLGITLLIVIACSLAGTSATAETALNFDDTQVWGFLFPLTFGWEFTVSEPITVNQLGIRDAEAPGLVVSHQVGIFRVSDQSLLTSATITNADTLDGLFRYKSVAPVTLQPGTVYMCAGFDPQYAQGAPLDYVGLPEIVHLTSTVAPVIAYRGWAIGETAGAFQFPQDYGTTMEPWGNSVGHLINANFTFTRNSSGCPLETIARERAGREPGGFDSAALLGTLRSFRDTVLSRSDEGRDVSRLYYRVSAELTSLLLTNPELSSEALSIAGDSLPAFRTALAPGGTVVVDRHTFERARALAREIELDASPELRSAIETVRRFVFVRLREGSESVEIRFAPDDTAGFFERRGEAARGR